MQNKPQEADQGLDQNGERSGSDPCNWSDANVAPPVYRVDLTRPVTHVEHGKAARNPALDLPRQANRKANPGEAAMRGSKKPRPVCNGLDMPTSIWSLVVRASMEPCLLRIANDDRHPSIGASQTGLRRAVCFGSRFVWQRSLRPSRRGVDRGIPMGSSPLRGSSRVKGNFQARF